MKYIIFVGDGMADDLPDSPLVVANTPTLDRLAKEGRTGLIKTVPDSYKPGSDIANLSLLGYDPARFYTGRGPLEVANLGVELKSDDIAYRCNLVTVIDNIMVDFTADHLATREAEKNINLLNKHLGNERIRFITGTSYRNALVINNGPLQFVATPPHDITDQKINEYLPKGPESSLIRDLMAMSKQIFTGKYPSQIWLWGQGRKPQLPAFQDLRGLKGAVITAVDLIKGIAKLGGLSAPLVKGATGYYDTDYQSKANTALDLLADHDFVFIHVEAPDEAGHEGNRAEKIRAIENFDQLVVKNVLDGLQKRNWPARVAVLPDHPTPLACRTHTADAVPFLIWGANVSADDTMRYNEADVNKDFIIKKGHYLLDLLINNKIEDN